MENRVYSDLDLNFTKHPITKDVARKLKENAVIASIKNIIFTNFNERPFNPNFGSGVRGLLFEPLDEITATNLYKVVFTAINNFEPRVKIDVIQVVPDPDRNGYEITIRFYLLNSLKPITISTFLDRLR